MLISEEEHKLLSEHTKSIKNMEQAKSKPHRADRKFTAIPHAFYYAP